MAESAEPKPRRKTVTTHEWIHRKRKEVFRFVAPFASLCCSHRPKAEKRHKKGQTKDKSEKEPKDGKEGRDCKEGKHHKHMFGGLVILPSNSYQFLILIQSSLDF